MRFDTFEQVKSWYDRTKPIISKNHILADDVRPLGERRYKWERITKINDNKYAILDGSWTPISYAHDTDAGRAFNTEMAEKLGTILWEKRDDGEYIHIRGCINSGYSVSRYKILNYCLPWTLRHYDNTRQGKHWITDTKSGKQYPLPKMKCVTEWQAHKISKYEDNSLTFKRMTDDKGETIGWERIGGVSILDTKLNLERKKQLKPAMKEFYAWMTTMQPLIPKDWESGRDFNNLMAEGLGIPSFWGGRGSEQVTPKFAESVITDDESPYRLAFAATLLRWMEVRVCPNKHNDKHKSTRRADGSWDFQVVPGEPYTEEETAAWYVRENKRLKASYNRYMNKLLGLFKTTTV